MGTHHAAYRFSVTIRTDDIAVLHLLRALCRHCESGKYQQIGWSGTGEGDWRKNGHEATLRFTRAENRTSFIAQANLLLPGLWRLVATNDQDPATPRP